MTWRTGDRLRLTCQGRTVPAKVELASGNGRSLVLSFDALLGGHLGMMPVLQDDAGRFASIVNGEPVCLAPEKGSDNG